MKLIAQTILAAASLSCGTCLMLNDEGWWGIALILLVFYAISPKEK